MNANVTRASKAQLVVVIAQRDALIAQMHKDIEDMRMRVSIAERNAPAKPAYVRAPYQRPMHFELAKAKAIASGRTVSVSNI